MTYLKFPKVKEQPTGDVAARAKGAAVQVATGLGAAAREVDSGR